MIVSRPHYRTICPSLWALCKNAHIFFYRLKGPGCCRCQKPEKSYLTFLEETASLMKLQRLTNYQLKLYLNRLVRPVLIGLDLGSSSSGVAVSCPNLKQAYFLRVIKNNNSSLPGNYVYQTLKDLCVKQKANAIIIGKTSYPDAQTRKEKFLSELPKFIPVPVTEIDQEGTTIQAQQVLVGFQNAVKKMGHLHRDKDLKDGIAAMIILQKYLDYYNK